MTFEIEQYELHVRAYRVEANRRGRGHSPTVQRRSGPHRQFARIHRSGRRIRMPADQNRTLADQLRSLGIAVDDDIIPSIRTIEKVE